MNTLVGNRALSPLAFWLVVLLAALGAGALAATVGYAGPLPQFLFGHDAISILDGAWKWNCGTYPHTDYYSFLGPFSYAVISFGITIGGVARALPIAVVLVALSILPIILYCAFTRLPPFAALIATWQVMGAALAAHALKFTSRDLSYQGIYNRWGYAIFALVMLTATVPPLRRFRGSAIIDGLIAGGCVATLVFLKITYGVMGGFLCFVGICFVWRNRDFCMAAIGSFVAGVVGFIIAIRGDVRAFVHDMSLAFTARQGLGAWGVISNAAFLWESLVHCAMLLVLLFLAETVRGVSLSRFVWPVRLVVAVSYVLCAVAIMMGNADEGSLPESPILSLFAIVTFGLLFIQDQHNALAAPRRARLAIALLAAFIMASVALPANARNIMSVIHAARFKYFGLSLPPDQVFATGPLKGFQIQGYGGDPPLPTSYIGKIQDGIALLGKIGHSGEPVACLDAIPPFNVAQGVRGKVGAPTSWTLRVISDRMAPPAAQVFSGSNIVMVPKQFGDGNQATLEILMRHYGSYLREHFTYAGESLQWQALLRKPQDPSVTENSE